MKTPNGRSEVKEAFGAGGKSGSDWYLKNVIRVKLPFKLLYEDKKGLVPVSHVYFHHKVAGALLGALTDIWAYARIEVKKKVGYDKTAAAYDKLTYQWLKDKGLLNYGGTFNYRKIRGSSAVSLHGLAIAIDMAPGANGLGKTTTSLPEWYIDCFRDHGFFWGGDFKGRKDPMHFQFATGC